MELNYCCDSFNLGVMSHFKWTQRMFPQAGNPSLPRVYVAYLFNFHALSMRVIYYSRGSINYGPRVHFESVKFSCSNSTYPPVVLNASRLCGDTSARAASQSKSSDFPRDRVQLRGEKQRRAAPAPPRRLCALMRG